PSSAIFFWLSPGRKKNARGRSPSPTTFLPLDGLDLRQPDDVRELLRLRLHYTYNASASKAAWLLRFKYWTSASDLQHPECFHGADRRVHRRSHRNEEGDLYLRNAVLYRLDCDRALRETGGNGQRTAHFWPRRRIPDRGSHNCGSEMGSRERTEFRLRHQSRDYPRGIMALGARAHGGSRCVQRRWLPSV